MTLDKMLYGALLAALLLPACVVAPGHRGPEVAPALPVVVELHLEPYYFHRGFYYYFHDDRRWSYARSRTGPWKALPPEHYPREVRFKDRDWGRDHGRDDDRDRDYRR